MSYLNQDEIASSPAMQARIAQAATSEDLPGGIDADSWTTMWRRTWAAAPGWDAAWASANVGHEDDPTYDAGTNEGAITDAMILSQIQAMIAEQEKDDAAGQ